MALQNQYFPQSIHHPGETLAEKLEEMGMPINEFALRSGKPEKTIIAVLNGESSITADMAIQFENVTKIPASFWMNHQRVYDEYIAREKHKEALKESAAWTKMFPIADMIRNNWISPIKTMEEKTEALLTFFGIANHKAWENYYVNQQLKVAFRISLAHTKEPHAISAWLRMGDLQASQLSAGVYSEKKLKETLPKIKTLMVKHPKGFFEELQHLCLNAGVKLVYTPCIKKAPINGATRWIKDTPLIQLSGRYNRNDIFWFTLFHELGHILLHGKKEIFLEDVEYKDSHCKKEKEADEFASKWLLSKEEESQIIDALPITENDIKIFSKKFNTHPAIIIGRLQHKKLISYTLGRKHFEPVSF